VGIPPPLLGPTNKIYLRKQARRAVTLRTYIVKVIFLTMGHRESTLGRESASVLRQCGPFLVCVLSVTLSLLYSLDKGSCDDLKVRMAIARLGTF